MKYEDGILVCERCYEAFVSFLDYTAMGMMLTSLFHNPDRFTELAQQIIEEGEGNG